MPRATVSTDSKRFELETLEGGFVEIRQVSYGAFLKRQDIMMKMSVEAQEKGAKGQMNMSMGSLEATQYMFTQCIVDHNLEDDDGRKLDFKKMSDMRKLDPKIGQEIDGLIDQMNVHLQEDNLEN